MARVGSWNDGSRLATVECIVDRHTLAIDESVFVAMPAGDDPSGRRSPYGDLHTNPTMIALSAGTKDKLLIDGHYYSDKSPVPALLMAIFYQLLQWLTGLRAAFQPEVFCWAMTLLSSGLPYVVAVWAVFRMGRSMRLPTSTQILLAGSLAVATLAPVYARSVNQHIQLLGVAALLDVGLIARLGRRLRGDHRRQGTLLAGLGCLTLAGSGYSIGTLARSPPMLACALGAWSPGGCRSVTQGVGLFLAAALPWPGVLHHAVNYAVAGTFTGGSTRSRSIFLWEGCPFNAGEHDHGNLEARPAWSKLSSGTPLCRSSSASAASSATTCRCSWRCRRWSVLAAQEAADSRVAGASVRLGCWWRAALAGVFGLLSNN